MGCVYTEGIVFMEQATGGSQEVTRMEGSQDKLCLHQRSPFTDCFKRQKEASRRLAEVVKDAARLEMYREATAAAGPGTGMSGHLLHTLHHLQELIKVDFAVIVFVSILHQFLNLLFRDVLPG